MADSWQLEANRLVASCFSSILCKGTKRQFGYHTCTPNIIKYAIKHVILRWKAWTFRITWELNSNPCNYSNNPRVWPNTWFVFMQVNSTDFLVGIKQQNVRTYSYSLLLVFYFSKNLLWNQWDKLLFILQVIYTFNLGWQAVISRTVTI